MGCCLVSVPGSLQNCCFCKHLDGTLQGLVCEMRKARHSLIHQWLRHATQTSEIAEASCSRCWQAGKYWFIPGSTRDQPCRWWGSMHFHLRECRISTTLLWFLQFKCLPAWPRQVVWWVQLWHCPEDPPSLPPSHPPGVSLGQTGAVIHGGRWVVTHDMPLNTSFISGDPPVTKGWPSAFCLLLHQGSDL